MFGKKKNPENISMPLAVPEPRNIKESIGDVSNGGLREVGSGMVPPPAPPPPRKMAPTAQRQSMPMPELMTRSPEAFQAANKESPPLFIKIDRYRELVQNIRDLKSYALSLRDALDALADIEKELKNGMNITQIVLDRFNKEIGQIDAKLMRVGAEQEVVEVPKEMDEYVKDLYDHVERIKHELRTINE